MPAAVGAWVAEMDGRGIRQQGRELLGGSAARAVRVRDGRPQVTEGPVPAAGEPITGSDILDCRDLGEAIEVAAKRPVATFGIIEVRPLGEPYPRRDLKGEDSTWIRGS